MKLPVKDERDTEWLSASKLAGGAGMFRWKIQTDELQCDDSLRRLCGLMPSEGIQKLADLLKATHLEDRRSVSSTWGRCAQEGSDLDLEFRTVWPDGSIHWLSFRGKTNLDDKGRPLHLVGAGMDVTVRRRYEGQLQDQRDILRKIVEGDPLEEVLECLTQAVERRAERPSMVTILLMKPDGTHLNPVAGMGVPPGWTKRIENLPVAPESMGCGSAVYFRKVVIVPDVQMDKRWEGYRDDARKYGLAACWASPIISRGGAVLGAFAIYYTKPSTPSDRELRYVEVLTPMAAIAIERKTAERALQAAHFETAKQAQELQGLSNAVPAFIAQVDREKRFQVCNQTFTIWTGRPYEEAKGRTIAEVLEPVVLNEVDSKIDAALAGETVQFEFLLHGHGPPRWVHALHTPKRDASGQIIGVIIFANDVTARKRAEEALRRSEERFRTMADNISQFAWMADPNGSIFWYNQRWFDYTGSNLEEMQGWGWTKVHHPDHVERVVKRIQHSWDTGELWEDTFPLRGKDGQYRWFLSRARPIRDENGKVLLWFGTNTDVTEQREAEEAKAAIRAKLEKFNSELEAQVKERTAWLQETVGELESISYSIAHDMRAPLRSLQGFSRILLEEHAEALDLEARGYLERIADSADRMDQMILDVLNYSKTVRGELPIQPVDIKQVIDNIIATYPSLASDKAEIIMEGSFPSVLGNKAALTQCCSNLLGNAVKFVAPSVKPKVRIWAETSGETVRISFEDNGIGIPANQHEKIFSLFQRLDKSYEGSGLGLAIVRKAVERMGGQVGVESEPGKGSRFWLKLRVCTQER